MSVNFLRLNVVVSAGFVIMFVSYFHSEFLLMPCSIQINQKSKVKLKSCKYVDAHMNSILLSTLCPSLFLLPPLSPHHF